MLFEHRVFRLSKDILDPHGYEDASAVDAAVGRAAVCDGVSSSIFSGRWASIVAQAAVAHPPDIRDPQTVEAWLKVQREAWIATIDESQLAWHQKPKLLEGAGTTLLWIELSSMTAADGVARPYRLRAYSIGDCCLFHIRGKVVLESFPIIESSRFESNPQVLRSVFKRTDTVAFETLETECHPGDLLLLCTDAVAAWTMRQWESGGAMDWEAYWAMPEPDWQQWLLGLRQQNQIRYDDSTAVLLRVGGQGGDAPIRRRREEDDENLMDKAENKLRDAFRSLKGNLRKGLRNLSDSKWLREDKER